LNFIVVCFINLLFFAVYKSYTDFISQRKGRYRFIQELWFVGLDTGVSNKGKLAENGLRVKGLVDFDHGRCVPDVQQMWDYSGNETRFHDQYQVCGQ